MTDAVKIPGALRTCVEGFVLVRKAPLLRCGLTRDLKVEGKGKEYSRRRKRHVQRPCGRKEQSTFKPIAFGVQWMTGGGMR